MKVKRLFCVRTIVPTSLTAVVSSFVSACILTVAVTYFRGALLAPKMYMWQSDSGYVKELGALNCSYHLDIVFSKGAPVKGTVYLDNGKSCKAREVWFTDDDNFIIVLNGIKGYYKFTGE